MTNEPQHDQDRDDDRDRDDEEGTVSEGAANPTPPATDATTSDDVHDTPQSPTRPEVADQPETHL